MNQQSPSLFPGLFFIIFTTWIITLYNYIIPHKFIFNHASTLQSEAIFFNNLISANPFNNILGGAYSYFIILFAPLLLLLLGYYFSQKSEQGVRLKVLVLSSLFLVLTHFIYNYYLFLTFEGSGDDVLAIIIFPFISLGYFIAFTIYSYIIFRFFKSSYRKEKVFQFINKYKSTLNKLPYIGALLVIVWYVLGGLLLYDYNTCGTLSSVIGNPKTYPNCVQAAIDNNPIPETCYLFDQPERCLNDLAFETKDISICIDHLNSAPLCMANVAGELKDISICDDIISIHGKSFAGIEGYDDCISILADNLADPGLCDLILQPHSIDSCIRNAKSVNYRIE